MATSIGLKIVAFLVPAIAIILGFAQSSLWPGKWFRDGLGGFAERSNPKFYVLLDDPLVVYVKDFITVEEATHLVALA
jgi:prolyl 4-hydroxylase